MRRCRRSLAQLLADLEQLAIINSAASDASFPRLRIEKTGFSDDDEFSVRGIREKLFQVLQNLLSNAASFSASSDEILITVCRDHNEILLKFEDRGGGIEPARLEDIFERFYSERRDPSDTGVHSGLGLSISRQIIEGHGGKIWAENITDQQGVRIGARFTIRLSAHHDNA